MNDKEFYEESRNKSKDYTNRYKNCKVLSDVDTEEVLLATREINDIPSSPQDIYHRVQSHETTRLDILAHKYYRNPLLWWVIAQANDIYDPLASLTPGTILRIPTIETLYGSKGILF